MTITCKLWLLAVVCVAFLYQDGPQGNGVLCVKKTVHRYDDNSSGAGSSDEDNAGYDSDNESGDSSGGGDSDGGGIRKNNVDSSAEDDDDDDDDHEEHLKHKTNTKSGRGKNHHRHHDNDEDDDDDDSKDNDDEEDGEDRTDEDDEETRDNSNDEDDKKHHKKIKKNIKNKKNNDIKEVKFLTTTTIKGKPDDILKFLNAGIKPFDPAAFDSDEKSNARLLKKIESITKSNKSSKGKKDANGDLKHYMQNIIMESSKRKKSKLVNPDEILLALVKNVLVKLLNEM